MPKNVTYRERNHARNWNTRFLLERERGARWLRRHARRYRESMDNRPWWWRFAVK